MSGKNMLDGFSRILDIQKFSWGGPPQTPLEKWDTWIKPSLNKIFLLTATTSQPGGWGANF